MLQITQNRSLVPLHPVAQDRIEVEIKQERGREVIYPVCELAHLFAQLAKQRTLSKGDIKIIKTMGIGVDVKQTQPAVL